ncbi:hypothetical protein [Spongiactinospora sp. TRM90649]|uniref:hypothetical protein n=1 Tax=Spongiactinospora sp. TRM90649 TaxID=3031114 RepID=UPI0023F90A8E|nr:hypothetical protein [Spongiactinospora sp. TRM90649]MDF5757121.1 hypothetical protein [Spongiactinospora sp. TRM90649]
MSRPRAFWLVLGRSPRLLFPPWAGPLFRAVEGAIAASAVAAAAAVLWFRSPVTAGELACAALVGSLAGLAFALAHRPPEHLHPLGPEHAELYALVREVAAEVGVRAPRRVLATAEADAKAVRTGPLRGELWIGLPYLTEMSPVELRSMVARELALLRERRSRLADAVYTLWVTHPGPPARASALALALLERADAACARVVGRETAALTLVRAQVLTNTFLWFTDRYGTPAATALDGFPLDLYAGWRWKIRNDFLAERGWLRMRARIAADQVGAARLRALGLDLSALPGPPAPGERGLPGLRDGLPGSVEARFARHHLRWWLSAGRDLANAGSLRGVPERVWDAHLDGRLGEVRTLLGMPGDAPPRRVAETVAAGWAAGQAPCEYQCPHAAPAVCALVPAIHRILRDAGYAYEDPLRQRVLVGWDGARADVVFVAEAIARGEPVAALLPVEAGRPDVS